MSARTAIFTVHVVNREERGEPLCEALVTLDGRPVFRVAKHPSQQIVLNEVVDWAVRLGKRDQLEWHYLK